MPNHVAPRYKSTLISITAIGSAALLLTCAPSSRRSPSPPELAVGLHFTNPVAPDGQDPWVIQRDGFYYYCYSRRGGIYVNKNRDIVKAIQMDGKKIWEAPAGTRYSSQIWAPELHFLGEKSFVYFAASDSDNKNHRMYVLEGKSPDPMGDYSFRGELKTPEEKWAIDGTIMQFDNGLFFIWSGWEGNENVQQNLYIARMKDPLTIEGERVLISEPEYDWERIGRPLINEGPGVLKNDEGDFFIIYSASGSWTDHYCLAQLRLTGENPMIPASWTKKRNPVLASSEDVISPGHASFVRSPEGTQNLIVHHAAKEPGSGWDRNIHIRTFTWDGEGNPDFGYGKGE
jgi:GH43 family beta-xylosidase